jgi:hypothetical protein
MNFDQKNNNRNQEAKNKPVVDHFQVCSFDQGLIDALIQSMHDKHHHKGQPDG